MHSVTDTYLKSILSSHGYSLTKPRRVVFNNLYGREPITMSALIRVVAEEVDRVSIYRAVKLFEQLGIVQRLNSGWKYKLELSDKFTAHHHHLNCTSCGIVININEERLEQFINSLAKDKKFLALAHQIEIQGLCIKCVNKK